MKNPRQTLGKIIRHFKAKAAKKIHDAGFGFQWQSKYHDRIIRNDDELNRVRNYIRNNPLNWHLFLSQTPYDSRVSRPVQ